MKPIRRVCGEMLSLCGDAAGMLAAVYLPLRVERATDDAAGMPAAVTPFAFRCSAVFRGCRLGAARRAHVRAPIAAFALLPSKAHPLTSPPFFVAALRPLASAAAAASPFALRRQGSPLNTRR